MKRVLFAVTLLALSTPAWASDLPVLAGTYLDTEVGNCVDAGHASSQTIQTLQFDSASAEVHWLDYASNTFVSEQPILFTHGTGMVTSYKLESEHKMTIGSQVYYVELGVVDGGIVMSALTLTHSHKASCTTQDTLTRVGP